MTSMRVQFKHWWGGLSLPRKAGFWVGVTAFPTTIAGFIGLLAPVYYWAFPKAAPLALQLVTIDVKSGRYTEFGGPPGRNFLEIHLTLHNRNDFPLYIIAGEENSVLGGMPNEVGLRAGNMLPIPHGVDVDAPLSPIKIRCENAVKYGRFVAEIKYGTRPDKLDKILLAKGDIEVTCAQNIRATWVPDGDSVQPTGLIAKVGPKPF